MRTRLMAAALAAASGSAATAQTVFFTQRLDDGEAHGRAEMVLRATWDAPAVVVAWQHDIVSSLTQIFYTVSTDGYQFRSDAGHITLPSGWSEYGGSNPMAAADASTWWVGYMGLNPGTGYDRFLIAPQGVSPNQAYAGTAVATTFSSGIFVDNGVLAAGLTSGTDPLGLVFLKTATSGHTRAMISPPQSTDYAVGNATGGNLMSPSGAIILRDSLATSELEGRWVTVALDRTPSQLPPVKAAYSDDGQNWIDSVAPAQATVPCPSPCTSPVSEDISWFTVDDPAAVLPEGGPYVTNYPAVAADPTDQSKVYMVFLGMTESTGSGRAADNIDLFIAQSTDGGENFSGATPAQEPGQRVLHLRDDDDLGDPAGSIQFLPSITVDYWGRVHVLYYVAYLGGIPPAVPVWKYKVKLVTISDFSVRPHPASTSIGHVELTGEFDLEHELVELKSGRRYLGEYMSSVDARKCGVYCGYIARVPDSEDGPGAYVSVVRVGNVRCEPDLTCYANCDHSTTSPILNVADFSCFLTAYATGCDTPITGHLGDGPCYANCDGSTAAPFLNVADFSCFLTKYASGCTQ